MSDYLTKALAESEREELIEALCYPVKWRDKGTPLQIVVERAMGGHEAAQVVDEYLLPVISRIVAAHEAKAHRELTARVTEIADAIQGDSGWEHDGGCEGNDLSNCFACIEHGLRAAIQPAESDEDEGEHFPWHYTEYGVQCVCGEPIVGPDCRCRGQI